MIFGDQPVTPVSGHASVSISMGMRLGNGTRLAWLLIAWSCAALRAQSPPVIRASTHLVQLSVTVTDGHGRHVAGLPREQFEILDEGTRQPIVFFSEPVAGQAPEPASAAPAGLFANQPAALQSAAPAPVTVILFDALNTRFSEQSQAREALTSFLEKGAGSGVVALYGLRTQLSLLADFSTDRAALLRGIARYAPAESVNREAAAPRPSAARFCFVDAPNNLDNRMEAQYYMPERRVGPTIAALTAIADRVAGIPGRKNLIWISGSFPLSFGVAQSRVFVNPLHHAATLETDVATLARRLNSADIAVYPVSTAGVASLDMGAEDHLSPMGSVTNAAANPILSATLHPDSSYAATLAKIADWTGGLASWSNDIGDQLRKAFDDGRQGYLLGFYAPDWDGKFHELRVKVHSPGVKARAREGYYAVDEPAIDPAKRLSAAVLNTVDAMEIPLDVAAAKQGPATHLTVTTRAHVPGSSLAFEKIADGWTARVKLVFVQMDGDGKRLTQLDQDLAMTLSETNHTKAATAGLRFTTPVAMRAGAEQLRLVLQDRASGAVGSVTMALSRIPDAQ